MEMNITFPGGKKVNAEWNGRVIATDQPEGGGGDAIVKAAELCAVKKAIMDPPEFAITTRLG
jgi:hypothetical protein